MIYLSIDNIIIRPKMLLLLACLCLTGAAKLASTAPASVSIRNVPRSSAWLSPLETSDVMIARSYFAPLSNRAQLHRSARQFAQQDSNNDQQQQASSGQQASGQQDQQGLQQQSSGQSSQQGLHAFRQGVQQAGAQQQQGQQQQTQQDQGLQQQSGQQSNQGSQQGLQQQSSDQQQQSSQQSGQSSSSSSASSRSFSAAGSNMGMSGDNGASLISSDGISIDKLYGTVNLDELVKPYGQPDNTVMDVPPVVLPPIEETREGDNRNFLQTVPDQFKQQQIVSNKVINTYSQQQKLVNVHNRNTINFLKNVHVNTDYITNIQRISHPKTQINTLTEVQNRYVPKLVVTHTRTDRINELPPKEIPQVVTNEQVKELPPVVEQAEIEKHGYDQTQPPQQPDQPPQQPDVQRTEVVATETAEENLTVPPPPPPTTTAPPPPPPPAQVYQPPPPPPQQPQQPQYQPPPPPPPPQEQNTPRPYVFRPPPPPQAPPAAFVPAQPDQQPEQPAQPAQPAQPQGFVPHQKGFFAFH